MKIYLTGATGAIGSAIAKKIPNSVCLVRKKSGLKNEIVSDFSDRELQSLLRDADVVLHFAGSLEFDNPKKLIETNVELTKRVVAATPKKAKIIYAGSISVYGKQPINGAINEETPVKPDSVYAETKLEAEKIVLAHGNAISLRIAAVYSPKIPVYKKMLELVKKKKLPILGKGANRLAFISAEDIAIVVENAIDAPSGVYVICGESLLQEEIYKIASELLNVPPPKIHVPIILAKIIGTFGLFPKEYIAFLTSDRVFDSSKARRDLNFSPRPLRKGLGELIKELNL